MLQEEKKYRQVIRQYKLLRNCGRVSEALDVLMVIKELEAAISDKYGYNVGYKLHNKYIKAKTTLCANIVRATCL